MTPPLERLPATLNKARFGLLMNQASVDDRFRYTHTLLAARYPGQLRALFGPQHGLWSEQQDNMIETGHATDPRLGVPIYSLYGSTREPEPEVLEGIDCLVVDLQDVGTRVYTYVWTLCLAMRACARAGVAVVVLDRPNPLGGEVVEGPRLDPAFASFVGLLPIPMRHGLTIGELARWMNRDIDCELHVVPLQDWTRSTLCTDTGRSWVPPSPNLPRAEAVLLYPGQVLLEGTTLSEGRGTTTPFEIVGAPFVDPFTLAAEMARQKHPGVVFRPYRFEPTFQKHAGASCGGVFVHVTDPRAVRSYRMTLGLLTAILALWPDDFAWRQPPYEYEERLMPIDILTGSDATRLGLDPGASEAHLDELARVNADAWWHEVADALLYRSAADA